MVFFNLVPVLGKHDYLRHQTSAPSVVFSVVASILSLKEGLTWKSLEVKNDVWVTRDRLI
jgi:hypothetical protein